MSGKYLGLIPARGGSKGVPRKNVRELDGRPLITYTIDAALSAERLDRVLVSTDDEEIRSVSREAGAETPFLRPAKLATDEAPTEPVIHHALDFLSESEGYSPDAVVLLQPTSPLRDDEAIDGALERFDGSGATSLVAVTEDHSNRWRHTDEGAKQLNYTGEVTRRQDKEPEYVENGAIYVTDREAFLKTGRIRVGETALFVMNDRDSIDIDTEFDLWQVEQFMTRWDGMENLAQ